MKKIIAALAILLGLSTVAHAGPLPEPTPHLTRLAYMRLAGGQYMLRSMPLFDVNPVGGVPIVGGGGGVTLSGTNVWTGTNTFTDSLFFLADDADATKKVQFQLSGISTATTRTFTMPDVSGVVWASTASNTVGAGSLILGNLSGVNGAIRIGPGGGTDGVLGWSVVQTPDTIFLGTNALANSIVIAEQADDSFDFAHAIQIDPEVFIQSHNQNTTQFMGIRHDGTHGFLDEGTGGGIVIRTTANNLLLGAGQAYVSSTTIFGWTSTTDATSGSPDLILRRAAAASLQHGSDVNGAPVDQTIKAHNGITGTDIKGAALILEAGIGTGVAVSNPFTINRQITKATGTTAQTYAPAYITCISKTMSNTSATAQAVATITTTSTTAGAVEWFYTTTASNGTLLDSDTGEILVAWNNNAGTVAATAGTAIGGVSSAASGTLASTPTATVATNVVSLKLTPTWAVIVPTVVTTYSTFLVASSADTVVCQ